jgi:(R,R)-butanediol dehydrogenase/meso-butanediol dehydrogenase/diacetyl reductase
VLQQAVESTKPCEGETIIVSLWEKDPVIKPNLMVLTERSMKGIIAYRDIFPAVLELMTRGYFPADKLVTKKIKLDDIVPEGFEALVNDKEQIKILVSPK